MGIYRYSGAGSWYRGNTHVHTNASDGGMDAAAVAELYASAGYDFLFRTDHWVDAGQAPAPCEPPLLWLDGVEIDGRDSTGAYYHVACLGTVRGLNPDMGFEAALASVREQGAFLVLAHPYWTGNSLADAFRHEFDGVEIYNHECRWLNGKGDSAYVWDAMLQRRPELAGFAVDDAHLRPENPEWAGGWVMVNAPACTESEIHAALRAGRFYSTRGPVFESIVCTGNTVRVRTSPVRFIRLVGPGAVGLRAWSYENQLVDRAEFEIPRDWAYTRLELEDDRGRRAWTNTLETVAP